jgi:hypothetical protein
MGVRENLRKILDKKQQEIDDLELRLRDARVYLQAVQDSMRLLPRENSLNDDPPKELRPGTLVAKARDAIRSVGRPVHIADLLKMLGKPIDKNNRVSLSGSLSAYVRNGQIFTRPAPNTFGLIELTGNISENEITSEDDIPANFGQ